MMARHAVPIFHPGHSLFFQKGEAARYRIPNRSIVDWRWIIGPDRSADGTEAKQGRKDHARHRRPHSFDGGAWSPRLTIQRFLFQSTAIRRDCEATFGTCLWRFLGWPGPCPSPDPPEPSVRRWPVTCEPAESGSYLS